MEDLINLDDRLRDAEPELVKRMRDEATHGYVRADLVRQVLGDQTKSVDMTTSTQLDTRNLFAGQ